MSGGGSSAQTGWVGEEEESSPPLLIHNSQKDGNPKMDLDLGSGVGLDFGCPRKVVADGY